MRLRLGTNRAIGRLERVTTLFDFVEVTSEVGTLPRRARLVAWRDTAPEGFGFAVALPRACCALDVSDEADAGWKYSLTAADALAARFVVARTPARVTPTRRNREKLAALAERIASAQQLVWQPCGLWESDEAEDVAASIGALLAVDLSRADAPAGPCLYGRLPRVGGRGGVSVGRAERVAQTVAGREEAWVVIEEPGARAGAQLVRRELEVALGEAAAP